MTIHGLNCGAGLQQPAVEAIKAVKEAVSIPVIGNGDIALRAMQRRCWNDALRRDNGRPGCQGQPMDFREIKALLEDNGHEPPLPAERIASAIRHLNLLAALKGEKIAVLEMRCHAGWYIGACRARAAQQRLYFSNSVEMAKYCSISKLAMITLL